MGGPKGANMKASEEGQNLLRGFYISISIKPNLTGEGDGKRRILQGKDGRAADRWTFNSPAFLSKGGDAH